MGCLFFFLLVKANAGNRNADSDATKVEVAACCVLEMDLCAPWQTESLERLQFEEEKLG